MTQASEYTKTYRLKHPDRFKESQKKWKLKNHDKLIGYSRKADQQRRDKAFIAYGGYKCTCCGETEKVFLTIDHINNDGNIHRKQIRSGSAFYSWLSTHHYPTGFQVLCRNCNWGKHANKGICPHKTH